MDTSNQLILPNSPIYPEYVAEIDWTFMDLVTVSRLDWLAVGRPVAYLIVDTYSGAILAAYVQVHTNEIS